MPSRVFSFPVILLLVVAASAQLPPKPAAVDNEFVQKQFGTSCRLNPAVPPLTADLNGDGVEDIVIAARCKEPMMDAAEHRYTVLDPYNSFYGFGDPKVTTAFSTADPENRSLAVLIIHGAGADGWRAAEPKAKFLLVNLPYKQLTVKRFLMRKKTVMAIYANESSDDQMTSAIFWDGKKYKYQPIGSSME